MKRRSARAALGPETSSMRFRDRTADGESHAHAVRLGGHEGLEDPLELARGMPPPLSVIVT
jgi:hypothetical protein